jgi:hypothetical protein
MSMVPLDPVGDISLILQIVILFLLVLGLPFVKGLGIKKNFLTHGYLTILALIMHSILTFIIMIPAFSNGIGDLGELSVFAALTVWSHAFLGTAAIILGFIVVGFWVSKPLSNMNCLKMKKIMLPLFIIWTISIVNGAMIHILGLL